jgi:hypothetical protein
LFILVSYIKGGTASGGVRERGAEEEFWLKSEEETGHWRKRHDEDLHDLHATVNFGVTKLQGIKCVARVTRNGET